MRGAEDNIDDIWKFGDDLRKRVENVFNSLIGRKQSKRKSDLLSTDAKLILVKAWIEKGHIRNPMGNYINFSLRHMVNFSKKVRGLLRHYDKPLRKPNNLKKNPSLCECRVLQNCV
jgi:hypothetical protein